MTATQTPIFPTEALHYTGERHGSNNGFRQRWLTLGKRHAEAINAARRGDMDAVLAHGSTLGGLTQPKTFARSALKQAAKLAADVPAYRIVRTEGGERIVAIANLTWTFHNRRQIAKIEWTPMWSVKG